MDKPIVRASRFGSNGYVTIGNVSITTTEAEFKELCRAVLTELKLENYREDLAQWLVDVDKHLAEEEN